MAASASRTLSICQGRTPIAVQPGSNCHIALRARKTASGYGATGPQPVKIVRSNRNARPGQSGGLRDGSTSIRFGTMKGRMGATHFLTKTLPKVAAEMALSVLAYNLTRVMNIIGIKPLIAAIAA